MKKLMLIFGVVSFLAVYTALLLDTLDKTKSTVKAVLNFYLKI